MRRLGRERNEVRLDCLQVAAPQAEPLLGQHHDAASLGGLVGQRGQMGGLGQFLFRHALGGDESRRLPVAQGDRARLVEQQHVDIARPPRRPVPTWRSTFAWLRRFIPAIPIADNRAPMVVGARQTSSATSTVRVIGCPWPETVDAVRRKGQQRRHDQQEDQRQGRQQNGQGDLVGRLLPLGPFDHRDHAVQEALARQHGHAHDDPIGDDPRAAGDGTAVAAAFADHRRTLAGDRALVDRGDSLDDFAVGRDDLARPHDHHVAPIQAAGGNVRRRTGGPVDDPMGGDLRPRLAQARRLGLARGLRQSPRRNWRTAR